MTSRRAAMAAAALSSFLTPPASPGGTWTETIVYSFTGGSDGYFPTGVSRSTAMASFMAPRYLAALQASAPSSPWRHSAVPLQPSLSEGTGRSADVARPSALGLTRISHPLANDVAHALLRALSRFVSTHEQSGGSGRRDECRRGTQECVRHIVTECLREMRVR